MKTKHLLISYFRSDTFAKHAHKPFYSPLSGTTQVSRYQKKHSPTHDLDYHPVFISFFHLPRSIASSLFKLHALLGNLFAQLLSMSSVVYLLVWSPPPHIPCISSPNHCLLFTAHAHTITSILSVLVFLSTPYLELCFLP